MNDHFTAKKNADIEATEPFPIVAIGASAGGLDAIIQFFKNIPAKNNMAFVVITHLDPEHKSIMPELIQKHTLMPVVAIIQGSLIQPNTIYVIPPNKNIMIKNQTLLLVDQDKFRYSTLPVNYFFHALAMEYGKNAVAVVLSGCGTDGTLGLRDIKQQGGIVVVQDPGTTSFSSMPLNAIQSGLADCVTTPEKLFHQIKRLRNLRHRDKNHFIDEMQHIFSILRAETGHDFAGYKTNVLKRRIERQMHRLHIDNLADYVRHLELNSNQAVHLFEDLLIGVTSFFRDPDAYIELKKEILPKLLKNKPTNYPFRVWIPGCASGEEAYSLAILLREYMNETQRYFHVQIFATDIDANALEIARAGIYRSSKIRKEINASRLSTWFIKYDDTYKIKKEIRDMIVFGVQNLIQDPPFTKLDLLSCRNVLIYLNAATQRRLFPLFHYSLKPNGVLFLGKSESASQYTQLFNPTGTNYNFFERNDCISSGYSYANRPIGQNLLKWSSFLPGEKLVVNNHLDLDYVLKETLIDQFVLPCLILDSEGEIIFSHGDLLNYLIGPVQLIHVNILDVVQPHIKATLMPYFCKTIHHQIDSCMTKSMINPYSSSSFINVLITPIHAADLQGLILIRFEEVHSHKISSEKQPGINKQLVDVKQELNLTKENLHTTIEELEASNEELQSTNEEFQSINEELETSKEELQSVNEELQIVNAELQNRIDQLAAINDDMNNLFNSTNIAAIFLDNDLSIKRFTPQVQDLVYLIPTDLGRSFRHFATNIKNDHLIENAEYVLKHLTNKTFEVQSKNDRWYLVNILPYRTLTNTVDGVVITFVEITQNKRIKETH